MDVRIASLAGLAPAAPVAGTPSAPAAKAAEGAAWRDTLAAGAPVRAGKAAAADASALTRFEAVVLQTFIAEMLPQDGDSVYGAGLSGDMWKSMLSEKIAEQVASNGGLGIAERIGEQLARRTARQADGA